MYSVIEFLWALGREEEPEMARSICDELLDAFCRPGARTYRQAADLLRACGFQKRQATEDLTLWKHARGILLLLPMNLDLKVSFKKLVERSILQVRLLDE